MCNHLEREFANQNEPPGDGRFGWAPTPILRGLVERHLEFKPCLPQS